MELEQPLAALRGKGPWGSWTRNDASDLRQIDAEDAVLGAWAGAKGRYLSRSRIAELLNAPCTAGGNEHDVLMFPEEGWVLRRTKNDMFGRPLRTPGEYLLRWILSNRMFPAAAVEFAGYARNTRGNGVIFLWQPLIEGTKRGPEAVAKAMGEKGFVKIAGWEDAYRHPATGIELWDAKPDNVIFDKAGQVVPIDVWINDPALILGSWDA